MGSWSRTFKLMLCFYSVCFILYKSLLIIKKKQWVECIRLERVFPADVFHIGSHHQVGFKSLQVNWQSKSSRWPREDHLHHKLVLSSEINMVYLKSKVLQDLRSSESWRYVELPQIFQRISIILSRKLLMSESILRSSEPIPMVNSD